MVSQQVSHHVYGHVIVSTEWWSARPQDISKGPITLGSFIGYPGSSTYSAIQMVILHTLHADVRRRWQGPFGVKCAEIQGTSLHLQALLYFILKGCT